MTHPFPHRRAAQCYAEKDDVQPRTSLSPCSAGLAVIRAPRLATSGPAEDVVEDAFDAERLIGVEENVEVLTGDGGFLRVHYPEDSVNFGSADDETPLRSEEHTSELQSLMRISYAVFSLKKKRTTDDHIN